MSGLSKFIVTFADGATIEVVSGNAACAAVGAASLRMNGGCCSASELTVTETWRMTPAGEIQVIDAASEFPTIELAAEVIVDSDEEDEEIIS